jgi:hypothetical protein
MYVAANPSSKFPHDGRFTRADRAFNACCAALALGASLESIADLVVARMEGRAKLVRKRVQALRLAQDRRLRSSLHLPAAGSLEAKEHVAAWQELLTRIPRKWVETGVLEHWFGLTPAAYERDMQALKIDAPHAYQAVVSGRVEGLKIGSETVITAMALQARLIVLHTALDRMELIRMFAQRPLGDLGGTTSAFPYIGSVFTECLIEPAKLIGNYAKAAHSPEGRKLDGKDAETVKHLHSKSLLPMKAEGHAIAQIGLLVRAKLDRTGVNTRQLTELSLRHAVDRAASLAEITPEIIRNAGWSRMSFAEFACGMNGYECATFVAGEVLAATIAIDRMTSTGSKISDQSDPGQMKVRMLAEILRSATGCDPMASRDPEPDNRNGGPAYREMHEKLRDPNVAARMRQMFGIDIQQWIGR